MVLRAFFLATASLAFAALPLKLQFTQLVHGLCCRALGHAAALLGHERVVLRNHLFLPLLALLAADLRVTKRTGPGGVGEENVQLVGRARQLLDEGAHVGVVLLQVPVLLNVVVGTYISLVTGGHMEDLCEEVRLGVEGQ